MGNQALQGIRIIDLSHSWAGPHCSRIFADFGAEVIKVEYVRRLCLLRGGRKDEKAYDKHVAWCQVNRNKYSVTLDLKNDKDHELLSDLIRSSDVLIENSRTGVMAGLGFSYEDVRQLKNDIIMLSMSAFGHTGPYASCSGYGAVMEGIGGIQSLTAYENSGKPLRIKELDITNGVAGACAVMNALFYRSRTGKGQHIDLSQLEAATHSLIGEHLLEFAMNGSCSLPTGNRHWKYAPRGCYPCKGSDKWLTITVRNQDEWQRFCEATGKMEWLTDKRFSNLESRRQNHDDLDMEITEWTKNKSPSGAMRILQAYDIAAAAVLDMEELVANSHLKKRGYFASVEDGEEKKIMGFPFSFSDSPGKVRWSGPELGFHNQFVTEKILGRPTEEAPSFSEDEVGTAFDPETE